MSSFLSKLVALLTDHEPAFDAFHEAIVSIAAIAAGAWVLLRLWRERSNQAALTIGFTADTIPSGSAYVSFLNVTLSNVGKSMIKAKVKNANKITYGDKDERLEYACSLQLRRVPPAPLLVEGELDWFKRLAVEDIPKLPAINLLSDYENPNRQNRLEFWMEPGESYNLGRPMVLGAGLYIAKITFIAAGSDTNYWTRVVQFIVPQAATQAETQRS